MRLHTFGEDNRFFPQADEDMLIAGTVIPKGWVNITQMCKGYGKTASSFLRRKGTQLLIQLLGLTQNPNVYKTIKSKGNVPYILRGVWVHPELAIDCASWINPKFSDWATNTLFTAGIPEQSRKFTDCLKEAILREYGQDFYESPRAASLFHIYSQNVQKCFSGFPSFNKRREECTQKELFLLGEFEKQFVALFETFYPDEKSFDEIFMLTLGILAN